jgi:hypothetical protein
MKRSRVLLQCSIPFAANDWHVGRFSLLAAELARWAHVTARNREPDRAGDDTTIRGLSREQYDQLWLLAVDGGTALSPAECDAINGFQRAGGGVLTARDHCNMGLWLRSIQGVGSAHFFHEPSCCEPDPTRCARDDQETTEVDWPNYHSGKNGDVQPLAIVEPVHPLVRNPNASTGRVERFPSHPHEGAVCVPADEIRARSVLRGKSVVTGREFDLVVAFERTRERPWRAVAQSSFHHFADYNWDTSKGAPTFVTEPEGDAIRRHPELLDDIRAYVKNCVEWLSPQGGVQ